MELIYTIADVNLELLHDELISIEPTFDSLVYNDDIDELKVTTTGSLTQEEQDAIGAAISAHVNLDKTLKIYDYTLTEKDHRELNYISGLTIKLFPKRTFIKGELTKVEWYVDEAMTDNLILTVDIEYVRDINYIAQSRTTTRTWKNKDGSDNSETKITKKLYTDGSQMREGKRRRGNNIDELEVMVLGLMIQTMYPAEEIADILDKGRAFMSFYENEISTYIRAGSLDFKDAVTNDSEIEHNWLDNQPAGLGGTITIREYVIGELS